MSSDASDSKKTSRGGIGGWMSNRGLIAKVSFAFVGTIFILIIIMGAAFYPSFTNDPLNRPATEPTAEPANPVASITVDTDKESYSPQEIIRISGNVGNPDSGKPLRIDIYNPNADILSFVNGIHVYPNGRGFYTYTVDPNAVMDAVHEVMPGEYNVVVAYLNQSAMAKFVIE